MDTLSPATSTVETHEGHADQPHLACIRLLKLHFENGGLDQKGFDMLHRMIQITSAIGWEVHVTFSSKIPWVRSTENVQWYIDCILEGCEVFRRKMAAAVKKAMDASASLPDLVKQKQGLITDIKFWQQNLSTLHKPTGNDRRLFELMLNHYNEVALQRLLRLHVRKPHYGLGLIVEGAKSVYIALEEVHLLAQQADDIVLALDQEFDAAINKLKPAEVREKPFVQGQVSSVTKVPELLPATVYRPPQYKRPGEGDLHLSKSFGIAEEELAHRGHTRAATYSETRYTAKHINSANDDPTAESSSQGPTLCSRRKGINVPRIFTGSFSQLESDLRRLQLDKVDTPVTQNIDRTDPVKVRDFGATPAATPAISPCTTPSLPSLQRREAVVSRDIEFQDRLLNGEVVKSRRPSTKSRAQTINDSTDALEAWLKEQRPGNDAADAPCSVIRRGNLKHRERTL